MAVTEFQENQFESAYPEGIERHYWSQARNRIIADFIRGVGCADTRMLEIGCGRGIVLESLRNAGFDCYGVDLADMEVKPALQDYLKSGINFEALDQEFAATIEVVLLFDVIEHIEDEKTFLENIRNMFPNLTHVIATVPARSELWSNYDTHYGHFRRYTRASLNSAFERSGLKTIRSSYFFHMLYIPALLLSMLGVGRKTVVAAPTGIMSVIHTYIGIGFVLEHKIVPSLVPGTSLIIASKPE